MLKYDDACSFPWYSFAVLAWHTNRYQIMHVNIAFRMTEIVIYASPSLPGMLKKLAPGLAAAQLTRIPKADLARGETSTTKSQGTMLTAVG
jgi:hypothetical protein